MTTPTEAEEQDRQARAIAAIVRTGRCLANPKTLAALRDASRGEAVKVLDTFPIQIQLSPYLPDGIWSPDLRYLPVEAFLDNDRLRDLVSEAGYQRLIDWPIAMEPPDA